MEETGRNPAERVRREKKGFPWEHSRQAYLSIVRFQCDIRINGSDGETGHNGPLPSPPLRHNERKYPRYANSPIIFGARGGGEGGGGGERRKKKRARGGTGAYVAFAYTTRPCMLVCIRAAKFAFSRQKTITIAGERGGREGGRKDGSFWSGCR